MTKDVSQTYGTALILRALSEKQLSHAREVFQDVHYYPPKSDKSKLSDSILQSIDSILLDWEGLPANGPIPSFSKVPRVKLVQLPSAGAERLIKDPAFQELIKQKQAGEKRDLVLANASGIHVTSIAPWCVGQTINLLHQMQKMIVRGHEEKRWLRDEMRGPFGEKDYYSRDLTGKTVGLLGYGTILRETARLFKVFNVDIIAANSSGKASRDHGFILPGTGDEHGEIPSQYYSTTDEASFNAFLKRSDVLICCLPSTPKTEYILNKERLAMLPRGALLLNVGRGTLFRTPDLIDALSHNIAGAALDVTDPEPLPANDPLWSEPNVIVSPHLSGNTEKEEAHIWELFLDNATRLKEGREFVNVVDLEKGY